MLHPVGYTLFRNPLAHSSTLAMLGLLQPGALGFLNCIDLFGLSVYYLSLSTVVYRSLVKQCP